MATKKKPGKKIGRFFPCPANGDSHPEIVAIEVKETIDAKGKTRHSFVCPFCSTRVFLNNWDPEESLRTIVWAEQQGLHCVGVTPKRKAELLKELGLQPIPQQPQGWQQPAPQFPMAVKNTPPRPGGKRPKK